MIYFDLLSTHGDFFRFLYHLLVAKHFYFKKLQQ